MDLNSTILHLLLASSSSSLNNRNGSHFEPQMVNSSLVIDIVKGLHEDLEFRNFVFYISSHLQQETTTTALFLEEFWQTFPCEPIMIMVDNPKSMVGLLNIPSLCVIMTTSWNDPIMELAALSLKSVRYFRTMFLLFPLEERDQEEVSLVNENIRLLYEWVWQKQFLNTMLITLRNNIYLYDPYPKGRIVNKTNNWELSDFFPSDKLNLKGMEIKSPIRFDLPRIFGLRRFPNKGRISRLSGTSGKLFGAFVMHINGSYNDTEILDHEFQPFNLLEFINMVETKQLEISVHSYTSMINASVGTSYPIGINDWCLMVPYRNSSPQYMFLQKSFQQNCWFLFTFAALYITVGIWLCSPKWERDISLSFLQTICSLLQISPLRLYTLPYIRLRYLFLLLFVVGFCLSNMYLTKMASNLAASSSPHQLNTIEDIIEAELKIMILGLEYPSLLKLNNNSEFLKLVLSVSKPEMDEHRDRFNTTYGYSVSTDRWVFLDKQQHFLKKPIFRLTSICSGPFYHVFPLQKDSHLLQPLKDFILAVSQSGYTFFWDDEAFDDALFLGYVKMFKNHEGFRPLSIYFFLSIYIVWCLGLFLSAVIFLMEIKRCSWAKMRATADRWFRWFK